MTRDVLGFTYSSGEMQGGVNGMADASGMLDSPTRDYEADAAPTDTCFGLVPEGSEELARNYRAFFNNTIEWVRSYSDNVRGAGLMLGQVRVNYDAADRPG
ncbi:hypothetical protein [Streptosporangium sp. NBC_01756]|uniref:hypothetical protein n=1 Tax=Streptosporangium sp. NBC_01756 TaxID=2975950 RepID=UPI002DDC7A7E|nr:hypothetical protein [Streptosporangium sp. NBC_01756]WSC84038.1 hypothetical protein OIE48_27060 [Streptosporangium sp. NBC_01756]